MFEIKRLNPDLTDDFINYFEDLVFTHAPQWKSCFCHFYHCDMPFEAWMKRTGEDNKFASIQAIKEGKMSGFLIYQDYKCIGWLNINEANHYPRLREVLTPFTVGKKIALSICFIIHPDFRGQGIARKLLSYAIQYYQDLGFDGMMALPSISVQEKDKRYRGTINMYLEHDYKIIDELEHFHIMYKALK